MAQLTPGHPWRMIPALAFPFAATFLVAGSSVCSGLNGQDGARWYRGNLHTHSLWSDGNDLPEMICDWYKRNGYDFVALSDHNILADREKWIDVNLIIRRGGRAWLGRYK